MYSGNNRLGRLYGALSITEDRETPVVLDAVKGYVDGDGNLIVTGENDIAILRGEQYWNDVLGEIDEAHIHRLPIYPEHSHVFLSATSHFHI